MQDKESATQANLTSPNVSIIDPETLSDLKSELEMVKTTAAKLKQDNTRFTAENEEMNHLTHSLRLEISQLKSTLEEKEDEIMTYRESARAAHEEIKLMNVATPSYKCDQCDKVFTGTRGLKVHRNSCGKERSPAAVAAEKCRDKKKARIAYLEAKLKENNISY